MTEDKTTASLASLKTDFPRPLSVGECSASAFVLSNFPNLAQFSPASRHSDHTKCSVRSQTAPPWLSTGAAAVDFARRARGMLGKKEGTVPPLLERLQLGRFMSASGVSWKAGRNSELEGGPADGNWVSLQSQGWHICAFRFNCGRRRDAARWRCEVWGEKLLRMWSTLERIVFAKLVCKENWIDWLVGSCGRVCEYIWNIGEDTTWYAWNDIRWHEMR